MWFVVFTLVATAEPDDSCSWCTCKGDLEDAAISDRRCRRPDWSCLDDPCASCAGLAWAPIRIGVAYVLLPICLTKAKWNGEPGCGDLSLFLLFGVPLKECPRPNIPKDAPSDEPIDEPPISVMFY